MSRFPNVEAQASAQLKGGDIATITKGFTKLKNAI